MNAGNRWSRCFLTCMNFAGSSASKINGNYGKSLVSSTLMVNCLWFTHAVTADLLRQSHQRHISASVRLSRVLRASPGEKTPAARLFWYHSLGLWCFRHSFTLVGLYLCIMSHLRESWGSLLKPRGWTLGKLTVARKRKKAWAGYSAVDGWVKEEKQSGS